MIFSPQEFSSSPSVLFSLFVQSAFFRRRFCSRSYCHYSTYTIQIIKQVKLVKRVRMFVACVPGSAACEEKVYKTHQYPGAYLKLGWNEELKVTLTVFVAGNTVLERTVFISVSLTVVNNSIFVVADWRWFFQLCYGHFEPLVIDRSEILPCWWQRIDLIIGKGWETWKFLKKLQISRRERQVYKGT